MNQNTDLDVKAIETMVVDWYKALDVHEPMVNILHMLASEGLEMQFPEATLKGVAEFEGWFQGVIRIFFDEEHVVKKTVVVKQEGERDGEYEVEVVVEWKASRWNPPAAYSDRIELDAYQRWVVVKSPETGEPVIKTYIVDRLDYHEGSAML